MGRRCPTGSMGRIPYIGCRQNLLWRRLFSLLPGLRCRITKIRLGTRNDIRWPRTRPLVMVLTADTSQQAKHDALAAGAADFLSKPLDSIEVLLRIENLLTSRKLNHQIQLYSEGLERLVDRRTLELQQQTAHLEKTLLELRATQQQVIQQERMRALGTMACGIAHDLNNGLSVILGYGDMLLPDLAKFPIESKARTYL